MGRLGAILKQRDEAKRQWVESNITKEDRLLEAEHLSLEGFQIIIEAHRAERRRKLEAGRKDLG